MEHFNECKTIKLFVGTTDLKGQDVVKVSAIESEVLDHEQQYRARALPYNIGTVTLVKLGNNWYVVDAKPVQDTIALNYLSNLERTEKILSN